MHLKKYFVHQQWVVGIGVSLLMGQLGLVSGWASPALAQLTQPGSKILINLDQASWIASLLNLTRFLGSIIGAVGTNYLGSKKSVFATIVPFALNWLIIALANNVEWLYVARLCAGFGIGMSYSSFPLFIGEVSMPEMRGALISMSSCGGPLGLVLSSVIGSNFSMAGSSYIYFALTVVSMVIFGWLLESPHHLIVIGDREGAEKSINYYRNGDGVERELEAVELFVRSSLNCSFMDKLREFRKPAIRNASFQVMVLFEIILKDGGFKYIDPSLIVIYVHLTGIVASIVASAMIDTCGRKFLLLISSIGIALSTAGLASHFMLIEMNKNVDHLQWLSACSLVLFEVTYYLGLMQVPSASLSEMFPTNIKCIAASFCGLVAAIVSFVATKTYQPVVDALGNSYIFIIYGACAFIVIPYAIFIMPETKGKTLQEIQDELIKKK